LPETLSATLSIDEFRSALETLTDIQVARLIKVAHLFSGGTGLDPAELFGVTVERALGGDRKCPREVHPLVFLKNAMRSVAWAIREGLKGAPKVVSLDTTMVDGRPLDIPDVRRSAEEKLVADVDCEERRCAIENLFMDDEQALMTIMADADGESAESTRAMLGLDKKAFATVRRRARNKINRAYPGGWQP